LLTEHPALIRTGRPSLGGPKSAMLAALRVLHVDTSHAPAKRAVNRGNEYSWPIS
jgi:hypothetical protein